MSRSSVSWGMAVLLCAGSALAQGVLHVAPQAPAKAAGTPEQPVSLQDALDLAAADPAVREIILAGGEYQFPIYGKNLSGVVFLDTGTVEENLSLSTFRAGAGVGLRFTVDMFGVPVPFALDFAAPLAKDKDDDTQVFSFSIDWSF